ncbi:ester cyclase [Pedococcus sp. 5OH_020]|uniref:ester cyclase n=1 Tax=Pedococcus sp. 5OH_020 TaxID=2989814 RepID=UPI0022E9E630|nr:ester cyclase [Pedococcus sp. 5OH_020]
MNGLPVGASAPQVSSSPENGEEEMAVAETERTIRGYLDALLSGGDFADFFAQDVVWTTMETGEELQGREAVRDFIVALHRELFDASPELGTLTTADGAAALEAVFVGKHIAEFAGIPATGAAVRLPYSVSYDLSDDKITALGAYFPILALAQQLRDATVPV